MSYDTISFEEKWREWVYTICEDHQNGQPFTTFGSYLEAGGIPAVGEKLLVRNRY